VKRSEALILLSRDHHHALDVARILGRTDGSDLEEALGRLAEFWEPRGRRHFEIEEELILPAVPPSDDEWREAAQRVREDHEWIRSRVAGLGDEPGVERAHELGRRMHDHVRFEERRLFGMLEERLTEDELLRLATAVEERHGPNKFGVASSLRGTRVVDP
jgi:hypothetical protein